MSQQSDVASPSASCLRADSLVSGPLSATSAFLAKVATSPQNDTSNYSHLICVYMPDVYDQDKVTEVWKLRYLLRPSLLRCGA